MAKAKIIVFLALIHLSLGCRSSVDTEREPILSHHGTEPPETNHNKPHTETKMKIDTGDKKEHEEGEIEVRPNVWEFPVAQTKKGMLWGTIEESRSGKRILAFRGIRHVQAPTGRFRWRAPMPAPSWEGIKEAKSNGHVCPQHMYYKPDIWIGQEDCLWLNVFTRDLVKSKRRPVLVWIHGGASVHYHMLSPMSRGLFNKAVSMSGTALCWWASLKRPLERSKKMARLTKCDYNKPDNKDTPEQKKKMVECLRSKSMEDLMNTHPNFYDWRHLEQCQEPMTAWSPRVDSESPMPFMPREPIDMMKEGSYTHVPWIVGITDDEGAFKASALMHDQKSIRELEEGFDRLGPYLFGFHDGQCEAPKIHSQQIKDYYWGNNEINFSNIKGFVNAISDSAYSHPVDTAAKLHAMKSMENVYMYHFGYHGKNSHTELDTNNYPPKIVAKEVNFGVGNGDDLIYLFPVLSGTFRPLPHEDLVFSERLIKLFVSFVATGTPKLQMEAGHEFVWNPVQASNATHLNIGNEMEMDHGLPNHERMNFWQTLPVYWNSNRDNYAPAPPIVFKDEL